MICSRNEITSVVYKAAVGSGLAVGVAEDIAKAAPQLCADGKPGVALAIKSFDCDVKAWCSALDLLASGAQTEIILQPEVILDVLASLALLAGQTYELTYHLQALGDCVSLTTSPGPPAQHQTAGAVEVDEADLARAQELAHKTYVPASDASRLKGAGAGLTDND